jgi:CheY-like chemotaxis protein
MVELPTSSASQSAPLVPAIPGRLHGLKVLVVEDEADARDLMEVILRTAGAQVVSVGSVTEALAAFDDARPTLLVSDIGMPDGDGYGLLRRIRERGIDVPAIAVTAYGRPEDREQARRAGFQLHVPKPIDPARFVDAVRGIVQTSPA